MPVQYCAQGASKLAQQYSKPPRQPSVFKCFVVYLVVGPVPVSSLLVLGLLCYLQVSNVSHRWLIFKAAMKHQADQGGMSMNQYPPKVRAIRSVKARSAGRFQSDQWNQARRGGCLALPPQGLTSLLRKRKPPLSTALSVSGGLRSRHPHTLNLNVDW